VKTITLSDEAYARLESAKRNPSESESDVVLRALHGLAPAPAGGWRRLACTSAEEREELRRLAKVVEEEFERIEPEDAG
jgi:hypothetical protein